MNAWSHPRVLPYVLMAVVLLIPAAMVGTSAPQPFVLALWIVLGAVVALSARRKPTAPPVSVHSQRVGAAIRELDYEVPEVRLKALQELAAMADEGLADKQVSVDAICRYLRRPPANGWYEPQVRRAAIALICERLQPGARHSWRGLNLDLAGAAIDGGSFEGAHFDNCVVDFTGARFTGDRVLFTGALFTDVTVRFTGASFSASLVDFRAAEFEGGTVDFTNARHRAGTLDFSYVTVNRCSMSFRDMHLDGQRVDFYAAWLDRGSLQFAQEHLGRVRLDNMLLDNARVTFG